MNKTLLALLFVTSMISYSSDACFKACADQIVHALVTTKKVLTVEELKLFTAKELQAFQD